MVDINDVLLISERWRATSAGGASGPGLVPYESTYDLDFDLDVDIVDIMTAAAEWGNTCQPAAPIVVATPADTPTPTALPEAQTPEAPLAGAARGAPDVWPAVLAVAILAVLVGALIWRGLRVR